MLGLLLVHAALAGEHRSLLPPMEPAGALADWPVQAGWRVAEARWPEGGGTRIGAMVHAPDDAALRLQARGLSRDDTTGWLEVEAIDRGDGWRVLVLDLGGRWPGAQVRALGLEGLDELGWELHVPVDEPRDVGPPAPRPPSVSAALQAIGVISREEWGASGTNCSTTEDDWYRFAIHHTAGSQTSGGTVEGAVEALQSYSMGSGGYCDIPYQFLVGYDGSLWEGRNLSYYSGATGGDNNDGNIAVCFLGCYHPSDCATSHDATDDMMAWGRLLVQTLADEHAITTDSDSLRGHQDWPGNATACPGDFVMDRLDELRSPVSYYQASFHDQSFPTLGEGSLAVAEGAEVPGWFELRNDGMETWRPGETWLAPTPRDVASAFAASDWTSPTRAATVDADTAPGAVGRFAFSLAGGAEGTQSFGLVQEWVTWFADAPYGGGPADDLLAVSIALDAGGTTTPGDTDAAADSGDTDAGPGGGGPGGGGPGGGPGGGDDGGPAASASYGALVPINELGGGCGCGGPAAPSIGWLLVTLALARRRR